MTDENENFSPEERRIWAHYKALKHRLDPRRESLGPNVFMVLARKWKRPVAEIKSVVGYRQSDV